jgi:hypothetical protein
VLGKDEARLRLAPCRNWSYMIVLNPGRFSYSEYRVRRHIPRAVTGNDLCPPRTPRRELAVYNGRSDSSMNKALSPWIWAVSRDVSKPNMTSRPCSEISHFQSVGR